MGDRLDLPVWKIDFPGISDILLEKTRRLKLSVRVPPRLPLLALFLLLAQVGFVPNSTALPVDAQSEQVRGFYPDEIVFFEVVDEDLAVAQVKDGGMDVYLWRLPSARASQILDDQSVGSVSAASMYSDLLFNPAPALDGFNPFSNKEFRQIVSRHLIDRDFVVKEILKGRGEPIIAAFGPFHPDYAEVIDIVESLNARTGYDVDFANEQITGIMLSVGATKNGGLWFYNGEPITLNLFIRSDDAVKRAIGEMMASDLEHLGFNVERIFGDLTKAFRVVYGSDPAALEWHVYTEGWASTAIVRYSDGYPGYYYAPWMANMPGWGQPSFWQYEHPLLDDLTQRLANAQYTDLEERSKLFRRSTEIGLEESVRNFISVELTSYVFNTDNVDQFAYDLFGGPLTYWFSRTVKLSDYDVGGTLKLGQKLMYQGAYNPVLGFQDVYSQNILRGITDPAAWPHPHTGRFLENRVEWTVDTAGPTGTLAVPADALKADLQTASFVPSGEGITATTKVTYNTKMSNFHHGPPMALEDLVNDFFSVFEWGTESSPEDTRFDGEYGRISFPARATFVAFRPLSENAIEVYFNYWHPDDSYMGAWMPAYSSMPWELSTLMEEVVAAEDVAYSKSRASVAGLPWLDLTKGPSLDFLKVKMDELRESNYIPNHLKPFVTSDEAQLRWDSLADWYDVHGHFLVANGPYFFSKSDVTARQDIIKAFRDPTYPFSPGDYDFLISPRTAQIMKIEAPDRVTVGGETEIKANIAVGNEPSHRAEVIYLVFTPDGDLAIKGVADPTDTVGEYLITMSAADTSKLQVGSYTLRVIATGFDAVIPSSLSTVLLTRSTFESVSEQVGGMDTRLAQSILDIDERVAAVEGGFEGLNERVDLVELNIRSDIVSAQRDVEEDVSKLRSEVQALGSEISSLAATNSLILGMLGLTLVLGVASLFFRRQST